MKTLLSSLLLKLVIWWLLFLSSLFDNWRLAIRIGNKTSQALKGKKNITEPKMWKLKIGAETIGEESENGSGKWLRSLNNHLGRQVWEFHPELGTPEELQQIQDARDAFSQHRFHKRHSSDLLMRIQVHPHPHFLKFLTGFWIWFVSTICILDWASPWCSLWIWYLSV